LLGREIGLGRSKLDRDQRAVVSQSAQQPATGIGRSGRHEGIKLQILCRGIHSLGLARSVAMRVVLITGASQGIGEATALHLDSLGFRVFAGVRSNAAAHALRQQGSPSLTPVLLDVTDPPAIHAAVAQVDEAGPYEFVGLVNNAAVSTPSPLEFVPLDEVRAQFEINVFGSLAVTQAMLPVIRRAGSGRIVNVSSINGRLAQRYIGVYSSTKFALEGMSDALRRELRRWKIRVILIQPGAIETEIFQTARTRGREVAKTLPPAARDLYGRVIEALLQRAGKPPSHALPPVYVARAIERALTAKRPRLRYRVGWDTRLGLFLDAILPARALDVILR
jgi:NAD(P)-dependent dehydrogenase (short-subunit alcohol dehydrogenase family)